MDKPRSLAHCVISQSSIPLSSIRSSTDRLSARGQVLLPAESDDASEIVNTL